MADPKDFIEKAIDELSDLITGANYYHTAASMLDSNSHIMRRLDLVIKTNLMILEVLDERKRG